MVSVTSASRYITSASRYHPRYQRRSSMYIRDLIPRNFAKLAEAVPIAINPSFIHAGNEDFDQTELMHSLISVHCEAQCNNILKVRKRSKIRNPFNQIPYQTQDIIWESDKNTRKHHLQESQEVSHFPTGDHKTASMVSNEF